MGKISYRPGKNNKQLAEAEVKENDYSRVDEIQKDKLTTQDIRAQEGIISEDYKTAAKNLSNIKPIGDLDCDYHIYLEDYVYTYLYQYAQVDLSTESSAVFLGQYYPESKEVVVRGIIPVPMDKLNGESEWIDEEVLREIEKEREEYFKNESIIGWMHMQPGYGTMLTMKELREHRRAFGETNGIFMLVDAINKIETLFVYENEELIEQSGYYMYYERNEAMQKYMLEHPFVKKEEKVTEDTVVNQFREIGRLRKQEYKQRKNVNFTVVIASIILIGLTAVIVKMNDSKNVKSVISQSENIASKDIPALSNSVGSEEDNIKFIINDKASQDKTNDADQTEQKDKLLVMPIKEEIAEEELTTKVESVKTEAAPQAEPAKAEVAEVVEKVDNNKEEVSQKEDQDKPQNTTQYKEYTVKDGDTLANICYNLYGSSSKSKEIAQINELGNTNFIRVGQTLKIPKN